MREAEEREAEALVSQRDDAIYEQERTPTRTPIYAPQPQHPVSQSRLDSNDSFADSPAPAVIATPPTTNCASLATLFCVFPS